jgi:cytoplasmic iron level regulating protein YaaA (DUF328/UPF0246 family)
MLMLLSPAKSLDYETPVPADLPHTVPAFVPQAQVLVERMRAFPPLQLGELMEVSDAIATLNVARFAAWRPRFTAKNAKQAVLAFDGDVYEGLHAKSLSLAQLQWAQDHVRILSGLYGVLRPLDWMQPYRLEMGTRVDTAQGSNLYQFWGTQIAEHLNLRLRKDKPPVLVNLASQEYFKSVDRKALKARVVECVFEDFKGGQYKVISFNAKRARGLMARWAIEHGTTRPEDLQAFDREAYAFDKAASGPDRWVFRRKLQD